MFIGGRGRHGRVCMRARKRDLLHKQRDLLQSVYARGARLPKQVSVPAVALSGGGVVREVIRPLLSVDGCA